MVGSKNSPLSLGGLGPPGLGPPPFSSTEVEKRWKRVSLKISPKKFPFVVACPWATKVGVEDLILFQSHFRNKWV